MDSGPSRPRSVSAMTVTEHTTTEQATTTLKNRSETNRNGASTEANADR